MIRRYCLYLLLALLPLAALAQGSRFERTVGALAASEDAELQARFASVALLELTETYLAEAGLARRQARDSENKRALLSWAGAVDRYAMQLLPLVEAVEAGAPVTLQRHPKEVPSLSVSGRAVLLAHPRLEQQPAYEQAVLSRFCRGDTCSELMAVKTAPLAPMPAPVNLSWEFGPGNAACVYHNLRVRFPGTANLNTRRELCAQLMRELEALASELARQPALGVMVEWDQLRITSLSGRPGHLVRLNRAGDSALLELPLMAATPEVIDAVAPWLRGRFAAGGAPGVTLSVTELGWE